MLDTNIIVDVQSNGDGTYDAYIATESSSGSHYPAISAVKIGENVADLIDTLEEEDSGNSYIRTKSYLMTCFDKKSDMIINAKTFDTIEDAYTAVIDDVNAYTKKYEMFKTAVSMKRPQLDAYVGPVAAYANKIENNKQIELIWNITNL